MPTDRTNNDGPCWPSYPFLILCVAILAAGYVAGIVLAKTPSGPVQVNFIDAPVTPASPVEPE